MDFKYYYFVFNTYLSITSFLDAIKLMSARQYI